MHQFSKDEMCWRIEQRYMRKEHHEPRENMFRLHFTLGHPRAVGSLDIDMVA